jgi:hypothetical protein
MNGMLVAKLLPRMVSHEPGCFDVLQGMFPMPLYSDSVLSEQPIGKCLSYGHL